MHTEGAIKCMCNALHSVNDVHDYVMAGLVAYEDLDERAIDALREFNEEGALTVLLQFKESDLSHVQVGTFTSSLGRWGGSICSIDPFSQIVHSRVKLRPVPVILT